MCLYSFPFCKENIQRICLSSSSTTSPFIVTMLCRNGEDSHIIIITQNGFMTVFSYFLFYLCDGMKMSLHCAVQYVSLELPFINNICCTSRHTYITPSSIINVYRKDHIDFSLLLLLDSLVMKAYFGEKKFSRNHHLSY